jgi:MFS family permease
MVFAVTYLAFGVATETWHAWLLFFIYGAHYGLTEPAEKALVKDLSPIEVRGRAYGYYNFVLGVSAIPAGVLTGYLWQTWSPFVALTTGACIATASSVALIVWSRSRPSQA